MAKKSKKDECDQAKRDAKLCDDVHHRKQVIKKLDANFLVNVLGLVLAAVSLSLAIYLLAR